MMRMRRNNILLSQDVEDDLLEGYPEYYSKNGKVLIYQNGKDNDQYLVEVKVYRIGLVD
jgi:hypothetical protein